MCYFREVEAKCCAAINPRPAEKIKDPGKRRNAHVTARIEAQVGINTGLTLHARYPPVFDSAAAWQSHQKPHVCCSASAGGWFQSMGDEFMHLTR